MTSQSLESNEPVRSNTADDLSRAIIATGELSRTVVKTALASIQRQTGAAGTTLFIPNQAGLEFNTVLGSNDCVERLTGTSISTDCGIVGSAFSHGEVIRTDSASSDCRFASEFDQLTGFRTGALIAVPVVHNSTPLAVIECVHGVGQARFLPDDEAFIKEMSLIVAPAINMQRDTIIEAASKLEQINGAVFFIDFEGFSSACQQIGNLEASTLMRTWFSKTLPILRKFNADFIKGTGDGCVVLFRSDTHDQKHLSDAYRCLIAIRDHFTSNPLKSGEYVCQFRYGLDCGELTFGNFGDLGNLQFDIIGNPVNFAARLQSITPTNLIGVSPKVASALVKELGSEIKIDLHRNEF